MSLYMHDSVLHLRKTSSCVSQPQQVDMLAKWHQQLSASEQAYALDHTALSLFGCGTGIKVLLFDAGLLQMPVQVS